MPYAEIFLLVQIHVKAEVSFLGDVVGVGHGATTGAGGEAGVTGNIVLLQSNISGGGNSNIPGGDGLPHRYGQTCGFPE